jgi:hypothetical protein
MDRTPSPTGPDPSRRQAALLIANLVVLVVLGVMGFMDAASSSGRSNPPTAGPSTTPSTGPETTPSTGPETTPSTGPETTPSTGPETTPSTRRPAGSTRRPTTRPTLPKTGAAVVDGAQTATLLVGVGLMLVVVAWAYRRRS